MWIPSAERLLSAWEAGAPLLPTGRALELLAAWDPEVSTRELAALPIGERDRRLLQMRLALFGSSLDATVACPACDARVEFLLPIVSLVLPASEVVTPVLDVGGALWEVRVPTSVDLLEIAGGEPEIAELTLMRRCVTRQGPGEPGRAADGRDWPHGLRDAVAEKMAALDPQADIQLSISCPACQHQWLSDFDVVTFFWTELTAWVRRLLLDVHRLASAYGWGQADILGMSSQRRSVYLELIGA